MFKHECLKCEGTGEIRWAKHVMNGVCFGCNGKGHVFLKRKRQTPANIRFKLFMMQDGKPIHCSWAETKSRAKKWLSMPGERWIEEVPR